MNQEIRSGHKPWEPNHFLFDFVAIFIFAAIAFEILRFIIWIASSFTIHFSSALFWSFVVGISLLMTVLGRRYQAAKARRKHWTQPLSEAEMEVHEREQKQKAQEEMRREQAAIFQASLRRKEEDDRRQESLHQAREAEISSLRHELENLKAIHIDSLQIRDEEHP